MITNGRAIRRAATKDRTGTPNRSRHCLTPAASHDPAAAGIAVREGRGRTMLVERLIPHALRTYLRRQELNRQEVNAILLHDVSV
jgi:hypothetical protein